MQESAETNMTEETPSPEMEMDLDLDLELAALQASIDELTNLKAKRRRFAPAFSSK